MGLKGLGRHGVGAKAGVGGPRGTAKVGLCYPGHNCCNCLCYACLLGECSGRSLTCTISLQQGP